MMIFYPLSLSFIFFHAARGAGKHANAVKEWPWYTLSCREVFILVSVFQENVVPYK